MIGGFQYQNKGKKEAPKTATIPSWMNCSDVVIAWPHKFGIDNPLPLLQALRNDAKFVRLAYQFLVSDGNVFVMMETSNGKKLGENEVTELSSYCRGFLAASRS